MGPFRLVTSVRPLMMLLAELLHELCLEAGSIDIHTHSLIRLLCSSALRAPSWTWSSCLWRFVMVENAFVVESLELDSASLMRHTCEVRNHSVILHIELIHSWEARLFC